MNWLVYKISENSENYPSEPQVAFSDCSFYMTHSSKPKDIQVAMIEKQQIFTFKKMGTENRELLL